MLLLSSEWSLWGCSDRALGCVCRKSIAMCERQKQWRNRDREDCQDIAGVHIYRPFWLLLKICRVDTRALALTIGMGVENIAYWSYISVYHDLE